VKAIQSGNGRFLGRQSARVVGWEIEFEARTMKILYDKKRKTIITILPPESVWEFEKVGASGEGGVKPPAPNSLREGVPQLEDICTIAQRINGCK